MQFVFGAVLITAGAMMIGISYHNHIAQAWQTITGAS